MNLGLIPLLIAALLMASADPGTETVELVLTGTHQISEHRGALVVADARVAIPSDEEVPGPVYVVAGELVVSGRVDTDVIQLAGTVTVEPGAQVGGELRHVGGTQQVSGSAQVAQRTSVAYNPTAGNPVAGIVSFVALTLLLAAAAHRLATRRASALRHVGGAIRGHPVITLTVGTLLTLTFISVFVFMAFTFVLLPVAIAGLLAGALVVGYGVIAWGDLIGDRLPIRRRGPSTALGVVAAMGAIQLVALIPVVGDVIALAILLTGVGAVTITYFGVAEFTPDILPQDG